MEETVTLDNDELDLISVFTHNKGSLLWFFYILDFFVVKEVRFIPLLVNLFHLAFKAVAGLDVWILKLCDIESNDKGYYT